MTHGMEHDRRQCRRFANPIEHGIQKVRIRPGHVAAIVNASAAGALLETEYRLLPGTVVELNMENAVHRTNVRGRVVRCAVSQVRAASVFYRGGIAFDRHLPWVASHEGYGLPASEQSDPQSRRAEATPIV
jgi:PilZ domain